MIFISRQICNWNLSFIKVYFHIILISTMFVLERKVWCMEDWITYTKVNSKLFKYADLYNQTLDQQNRQLFQLVVFYNWGLCNIFLHILSNLSLHTSFVACCLTIWLHGHWRGFVLRYCEYFLVFDDMATIAELVNLFTLSLFFMENWHK